MNARRLEAATCLVRRASSSWRNRGSKSPLLRPDAAARLGLPAYVCLPMDKPSKTSQSSPAGVLLAYLTASKCACGYYVCQDQATPGKGGQEMNYGRTVDKALYWAGIESDEWYNMAEVKGIWNKATQGMERRAYESEIATTRLGDSYVLLRQRVKSGAAAGSGCASAPPPCPARLVRQEGPRALGASARRIAAYAALCQAEARGRDRWALCAQHAGGLLRVMACLGLAWLLQQLLQRRWRRQLRQLPAAPPLEARGGSQGAPPDPGRLGPRSAGGCRRCNLQQPTIGCAAKGTHGPGPDHPRCSAGSGAEGMKAPWRAAFSACASLPCCRSIFGPAKMLHSLLLGHLLLGVPAKQQCTDLQWKSKSGFGCPTYVQNNWCKDGKEGTGWNKALGTFHDWADKNDVSAYEACCACGGGKRPPVPLSPERCVGKLMGHRCFLAGEDMKACLQCLVSAPDFRAWGCSLDQLTQMCTWAYEEEDDDYRLAFEHTKQHRAWEGGQGFRQGEQKSLPKLGKEKGMKGLQKLKEGVEAFAKLLDTVEGANPDFKTKETNIIEAFTQDPKQDLDAKFYEKAVSKGVPKVKVNLRKAAVEEYSHTATQMRKMWTENELKTGDFPVFKKRDEPPDTAAREAELKKDHWVRSFLVCRSANSFVTPLSLLCTGLPALRLVRPCAKRKRNRARGEWTRGTADHHKAARLWIRWISL